MDGLDDSFYSILILNNKFYLGGYKTFVESSNLSSYSAVNPDYKSYLLFYSKTRLYSAGEAGGIYSTDDFGTWVKRYSGTSSNLYSISCSDTKCVMVGQGGVILYKNLQ